MNPQELFIKYNNKVLDFDGLFGGQCVDPIKAYFKEVLNLTPIAGNAIDYWKDIPNFTRIKNNWTVYPKPGDLIIWNTGSYGHIGICNWVRTFDLNVFEQNNPIGSPCHFGTHNYNNILGWLRPLTLPAEAPRPTSKQPIDFEICYLSDTDDINDAVVYCDQKFKEFTGGLLGVDFSFKQIPRVDSPAGSDLDQFKAMAIVDSQTYELPKHGVVLGYHGSNSSQGYKTYVSTKGHVMTDGYKPIPKEVLLFELKHQAVIYYNKHRGTNPFIENIDNYTMADGGLVLVEQQLKSLIPYISVFKLT